MFVGRKEEINKLSNYLGNNNSILIYGLRRVGKTSLIKETMRLNNKKHIYYECIKASEKQNVDYFIDLLKEEIDFPSLIFNDFLSVFKYLNNNYNNYTFVIDEYSYLKEYYISSKKQGSIQEAMRIDSSFQKIIDEFLTNNSLILCGSSISIMKGLIEYNSPLYDRFKFVLHLREFNYQEIKEFFPNLSNRGLVEFYSVFGGSPNVLSKLDETKSLKENICILLLSDDSKIKNHIALNIFSEFDKDRELNNVLDVIKNGAKSYGDIGKKSHIETNGLLDKKLKKLIDLDIVEKIYPINMENDNKKGLYEIKDNLLKFYYSYLYGKSNLIYLFGPDRFFDEYIKKSLNEFISRRFERITRDYFSIMIRKGKYRDVVGVGAYFTSNSEFDCVLKKKDYTYSVYEAKYYDGPISEKLQLKEIGEIKDIKGINVNNIGFVSSCGFEKEIEGIDYLDLNDLYDN